MKHNNSIQSITSEESVRCIPKEIQDKTSGGRVWGCCQYPPPGYAYSQYHNNGMYFYYN